MLIKRLKGVIKKLLLTLIISATVLSFTGLNSVSAESTYYKENDKPICIAIDSGHNLKESSYKCDYNGVGEVEYNYEIAKRVIMKIKEKRPDVEIYETNPNKTNELRSGRADQCKQNNVDFIFSIHQDAIGHTKQNQVTGTHMIVDGNSRENVTTYLAKQIIKDYSKETGIPLRFKDGVDNTRSNIGLLHRATELGIPAMLLECNFYDNNTYNDLINTEKGLDDIANVISDNIILHIVTYLDKVNSTEINPQNQYIKFRIN